MLGQTIKEINYLISLLNNMTQPNDNSFYVTLTSQKTQDSPVIVTLFFKKKLTESQRKYIKLDESFDRDQSI